MVSIVCRQHIWLGASPAAMEDGETERRCQDCGARERSFILPYIPAGANKLHRLHYHQVASLRRQLRDDVALLTRREPLWEHARLTIDFRWKDKRAHDIDNALAGFKAGIDALKGRWFVDDDTAHLEVVPLGVTGTGRPDCVVVRCEEM